MQPTTNHFASLLANTQQHLNQAESLFTSISHAYQHDPDADKDPEVEWNNLNFDHLVRICRRNIVLLLDIIGAQSTIKLLNEEYAAASDQYMVLIGWTGDYYNPQLSLLETYFASISAEDTTNDKHTSVEQVLRGTSTIIEHRNIDPAQETEVTSAVFQVLIHAFPDATKSVNIPKGFQNYKPDLAIPSLQSAIEFKFIDSEEELKTAMRGINEDVTGYRDSHFKRFYAVFYMTRPFFTEPQIKSLFTDIKKSDNWTPILVNGPGGRTRRRRLKNPTATKGRK